MLGSSKKLTATSVEEYLQTVTELIPCLKTEAQRIVRGGHESGNNNGEKSDQEVDDAAEGEEQDGSEENEVEEDGEEGVSAGGGSDAGNEEVDLEEGDEMSGGGVSTAADALQEKQILTANVIYIFMPLRLILRMLLS